MGNRAFTVEGLRILKTATTDAGYSQLHAHTDLRMLLTFLERFDRLGWLPPVDEKKRRLLAAFDVIIHVVDPRLCFYEFCSKGARGERDPWLSVFFHVNHSDRQVRVCGVELTAFVERRRALVLEKIRMRVEKLGRWLDERDEDR